MNTAALLAPPDATGALMRAVRDPRLLREHACGGGWTGRADCPTCQADELVLLFARAVARAERP